MKKFWADFKKFISRGNVLDMAVGVIVGSAFSAIVTALTNKIIMPLINMLLSIGGNGLESAYTVLKWVGDADGKFDPNKSIYIDWGAFITAIINFFIIAFTLFVIIRVMMNARGYFEKAVKGRLTKEQRMELLSRGVNIKNRKAVKAELIKMAEEEKERAEAEKVANAKPTDIELLTEIRDLLKNQSTKE